MRAPLYVILNVDLQNKKNRRFYLQRLRLLILSSKISCSLWISQVLYGFMMLQSFIDVFIWIKQKTEPENLDWYLYFCECNINCVGYITNKIIDRQHNNPHEVSFINFSLQGSFSPNLPIYFFHLDL